MEGQAMTEAEWLTCEEPKAMINFISDHFDERKMRLFALAGCRRVEHLLTPHEKNCRAAIAALERRLEGTASENDLQTILLMSIEIHGHVRNPGHAAGYALDAATYVVYCLGNANWQALTDNVSEAIAYDALARSGNRELERIDTLWMQRHSGFDEFHWQRDADAVTSLPEYLAPLKVERSNQADLLRDIFGNPFHPATFDPAWSTETVVALARQMYESRDFSAMPIMADALQDAGCGDEQVLSHCREPGVHVRGCFVVDSCLGNE